MEIAGADGSKFEINPGQTMELGRGHGLNSADKAVSRRQVSFVVREFNHNRKLRVQFEVLGRNPIYVSSNNEVRIHRRFERGEMESGDMFCVSAKDPVWYSLQELGSCSEGVRRNDLESEFAGDLGSEFGDRSGEDFQRGDDVDVSDIDPVTEFGFLVIGHELDLYPKKMICDVKDLNWFLEEGRGKDDDNVDEGEKGKRVGRKKRKKGAENDDEDWTGESEDDDTLVNKRMNAQRPKYITRSKDRGKRSQATAKSSTREKTQDVDDDDDNDDGDEDDEKLGGFIVNNENLDEDEESGDRDEDEEEEEFVDEDDE